MRDPVSHAILDDVRLVPSRPEIPDRDDLSALARAAMSGNEPAFEHIHRRLGAGLHRFFLKRTRGQADVSDELAQRTWMQAWKSLRDRRYDPARAAISTFVYAIGHHVWLQHRRSTATGLSITAESERLFQLVESNEDDPARIMAAAEVLEAVRESLRGDRGADGLSDEERVVIRATAAGQSERELAAKLGVAASTIHARKTAAFAKMRRKLSRSGLSPEDSERGGRPGE